MERIKPEDESLDSFELDAKIYLDKTGRRHLNIVNNVLTIIINARETGRCTYAEYIEVFRIVIQVKRMLLDKGHITITEMNALNDISLSYSERL